MLKRRIILPVCATEVDPYQDFLTSFGVSSETESPEPDNEGSEPESEPSIEPETTEPEVTEPETTEPEVKPQPRQDKSGNAFAQMRVENKRLQDMLKGVAGILGVQNTTQEDLVKALQEKITVAQAKQQGIPPEIAQRLAVLEQQNQEYTLMEARKNAYLGFQQVKDTFGIDDTALNAFADTLQADGINPFDTPVNLVNEYKLRNYEALIKQAEERGAKAEALRASKANSKGSTPNNQVGAELEQPDKISTLSDLSKWLDKMK